MNKLLKVLLSGVLLIGLLIGGAIAYVILVIDPNDYKPQIKDAAAKQGIELDIAGDLDWQIVPGLAIRVGETGLSSSTRAVPDTRFDSASLSLAWLPLLNKQIHISAIAIDGADIRITSSEEAASTAAAPTTASGDENDSESDRAFGIAVDSIKVTNSRVTIPGKQGNADTVLDKLSFTGKNINLEGEIFTTALAFDFNDGSLPKPLSLKINTEIGVNQNSEHVQLQSLVITFDETIITGNANAKLSAPKALSANIRGNTININRYIVDSGKEESGGEAPAGPAQATAIFAPLAAPIAFLEGGRGDIDLTWDALILDGLSVDAIHYGMSISGTTVDITDFSANTLGGTIKATARLGNVTGRTPSVSYTAEITGISLAAASKAFTDGAETDGTLSATVKGKSRGANSEALLDNLSSDGTLHIVDPELKTVNIEQSYCKIASMVEKVPLKEDWPAGTKLNNVEGKFRMQGRTLILDGVNSGIGNLALTSTGKIDLGAGAFNILAVTRLNGDRTSETGCVVESTKLHNRDIPLRCKDTFENAGAKSCLPDGDIVRQLARAEIADKISEKLGDKIDPESDTGKAVDSLLKGIFGRKKEE